MFSPTEDQSRTPHPWRAALRNAAELVVAFATLDGYTLPGPSHASPAGADAPLFDLDGDRWTWPEPRHPEDRIVTARRRGHGRPPVSPAVCLHGGRSTVPTR
ncbi:hypothetical protein DSM112329_02397 [Paraconexibacter sp. AEG42_29]|uniref:Uncharacterized protein n=1 Tax=Paraconexibacter sp. AEG42_29 TaxID=2997339 RepID=A0AAU7AVA3_9ACTN